VAALRGTEYTLDIDPKKIQEAENVFQDCMSKYFLPPEATAVNPIIPFSRCRRRADGQYPNDARQRHL
jgi:pyruvate/oxaloacetate carboxyltransferase